MPRFDVRGDGLGVRFGPFQFECQTHPVVLGLEFDFQFDLLGDADANGVRPLT